MRKKCFVVCLLALVVAGSFAVPRVVQSTIPVVSYVTPNATVHKNVVQCSATIQSQQVRQIVLQTPVVPENVTVSIGDIVEEGQVLATVDMERTEQMMQPVRLLQEMTDELHPSGTERTDWAALAASYGLNATVMGSNVLPFSTDALEEILGTGNVQDTSKTLAGMLENGQIKAPVCGVVTAVELQSGVPVTAGTAIVTIADHQSYKAIASVREEDIARVQVGNRAEVTGVGFSGQAYSGTVTKIYPMAHKTFNGSTFETVVTAEITLEQPDQELKPGFTATVEIQGGEDNKLLTVPYEAIKQDEDNNEYVYLYKSGKIKKQVVVTGRELTNEVEVLSGIEPDSILVYNPTDAVQEGNMVHLKGRADDD